jgi:asparaginyl-tRNA synthetase
MTLQRIKTLTQSGQPGTPVTIQGWVRTKREQKAFTFINVNDGSTMNGLQVVADADTADYDAVIKRLNTGRRCG